MGRRKGGMAEGRKEGGGRKGRWEELRKEGRKKGRVKGRKGGRLERMEGKEGHLQILNLRGPGAFWRACKAILDLGL